MEVRLGDLLMERGVLDAQQVAHLLEVQEETCEPLGLLAERVFGVDPAEIEASWAHQYAMLTPTIDPDGEPFEPSALELVSRRQAWQFRVLPVRFDPHELMIATTQVHLPRALRFAANVIGCPLYFVLCDGERLGQALCRHYPLAGFTPRSVHDDQLDRLFGAALRRPAEITPSKA